MSGVSAHDGVAPGSPAELVRLSRLARRATMARSSGSTYPCGEDRTAPPCEAAERLARALALARRGRSLDPEREAERGHRHEDELEPERAEDRRREHVAERDHGARASSASSPGRAVSRRRQHEQAAAARTPPTRYERRVPLAAAQEADVRAEELDERRRGSGDAMKPHDVSARRLRVVHEQREQVPDRRRRRAASAGSAAATPVANSVTGHARAVAERTPADRRGSGSTCCRA